MCVRPSHAASEDNTPTSNHMTDMTKRPHSSSSPAPSRRMSRHYSFSSVSTASSSWSPSKVHETVSGQWLEDSKCRTCGNCNRVFTLVNRRHHCRVCGNIFCHACSRTRMVLQTNPGEIPRRQRVCDPCASRAQGGSILYDEEEEDLQETGRRNSSSYKSLDEKQAFLDTDASVTSTSSSLSSQEPTISFFLGSMGCYAAAFWFLKDEVSLSNPAIWILLAGFCKNLYELIMAMACRQQLARVTPDDAEEVFNNLDAMLDETPPSYASNPQEPISPPKPLRDELMLTPAQEAKILSGAQETMDIVWKLAMSTEGWTSETSAMEGVTLWSRDGKPARIFKSEAEIDLSPEELFDELYGQFEYSSSWNVTAAENKILRKLDDKTDIVHLVTAPALGGMITSRDFVNSRTWRKQDGGYLIASTCAGKNLLKTSKGVTRGENGPTGFIILPHEASAFKSRFIWILNCDIKGYFPSSIIRKGSISEIGCFVRNLRRHIAATAGSDSI